MVRPGFALYLGNRLADADSFYELLKQKDSAELHNLLAGGGKRRKIRCRRTSTSLQGHLDPSEGNFSDWGSELICTVSLDRRSLFFEKAAQRYPNSPRTYSRQIVIGIVVLRSNRELLGIRSADCNFQAV